MSVIVTLRVPGDPQAMERHAQENPEAIQEIMALAKSHGLIAHRFYGSEGQILVIDEWPSPESFQSFFAGAESHIEPIMQAAARGEPEVTFWTKLDTGDDFGWGVES